MANTAQDRKERYEAKRIIKKVSFNNETEIDLIHKIEKIQADMGLSFSEWVKKQIENA